MQCSFHHLARVNRAGVDGAEKQLLISEDTALLVQNSTANRSDSRPTSLPANNLAATAGFSMPAFAEHLPTQSRALSRTSRARDTVVAGCFSDVQIHGASSRKKETHPAPGDGCVPVGLTKQNSCYPLAIQDRGARHDRLPNRPPRTRPTSITGSSRWPAPTASASPPPVIRALAADLARVGIDIRQIRTRTQALAALELSSEQALDQLAAYATADPKLGAILAPLFEEDCPT